VSQISSRYPGLVEVLFHFTASISRAFAAADGAANFRSRRGLPLLVSSVVASGFRTRGGDRAMIAPAWRGSAAALSDATDRAAASDVPRHTLGWRWAGRS
jgi:hypothetical protein